MTLCINPDCRLANPNGILFCQNCGSELLLQGRYQVIRLLNNQGTCTETYEILHQGFPKILKVLKEWELREDFKQKTIELFERDFQVLSKSNHLGIPKIEDCFQYTTRNGQTSLHCVVMEKILGTNLEEYIKQLGRPIEQQSAVIWLEQLLHILKEIHNQGIIHKDINPSNIILKPNGQLSVVGFGGVGQFYQIQAPTEGSTHIYSPNYTAEEQKQGKFLPQSDFFSLGLAFVYLLTGKDQRELHYTNNKLEWHQFVNSISPEFLAMIDWLIAPLIEQRPANANEILQQLTVFKPTHSSNVNAAEEVAKTMFKKSKALTWPIVLGGLVFLTLSGGAIFSLISLINRKTSLVTASAKPPQCSASTLVKKSGNLYGVIEVGSTGIKAEVIQELPTVNEHGFKFIAREEAIEERNANAVDPKAQKEAVDAVKGMFTEIQQRFGIPCEQIVIYGSSGVASKAPHKNALAKEVQQETGRVMEFISAEEEANFVFSGVVPDWRRRQVVMIDIGSGNTKGGYQKSTKKGENVTFSVPFGTKTFTKEISNSQGNTDFIKAAENTKRQILIPQIRDIVQRKPGAQNLQRVYLAGGISWALSTLIRPCEQEQTVANIRDERVARFVRIYPEDINTFYYNATRDQKTLFAPDLGKCKTEEKEKVQKDIEKIKTETFSIDNLIAGAEILRALSSELKFSEKERIFFARYAIEALPIGYLIQKLESSEENVTK
ncbi:protein kinase [Calothrix sp. PCC 7507]|uniref:protein kinase domain-containing protein n=1 Tax=Calothrix sp. PCC 7507 TaxID=99598 RepID=UPI00029ECF27|nr:protein kinase [Calothrix sp. PCC 7507]AFY30610.1 serine/threonine protein kinase [Calothrix sp. PCC 7507]